MTFERDVYKKVKSIKFGALSPKMIKEMSVVKIVTPELYDKEGYPVDGGLMDTRLGVIDPGLRCRTCGGNLKTCPGHFGYIELARPVIHLKFAKLIKAILSSTCPHCGRIKATEEDIKIFKKKLKKAEEEGIQEINNVAKEIRNKLKTVSKCPYCHAKIPKIKLEKPTTFLEDGREIKPIEIRTRLERVSDEDCQLLGVDTNSMRPEWAVLTILPIPPVTMRTSITLESGQRSEDDLTHKLGDIVRINQRLFENINAGAPEVIIEDLWELLQYHVTTFFDNTVSQVPPARHRSGQPLKTITERIKTKEGRIRHNLVGKRVNFSSRTVISPDPEIALDEVGVPFDIAKILTVPLKITEWNLEYAKSFLKNGQKKHPGVNYIIRPDGARKKVTKEILDDLMEEIQPGYTIERHLIDGDIVVFNRQPSLHRMSMMGHKVKVLPGKTFRLNPAVCNPYNADFDGDEMNLHVPQTQEAMAEVDMLMEVQTQIISPKFGLSVIGTIQDGIEGSYLLTTKKEIKRTKAIQLLVQSGVPLEEIDLPKKEYVKGSEVFSVLIPKDFNYTGETKKGDEILIEKGKLKKGYMDSQNIGQGRGLLVRKLHKAYGEKFTIDFMAKVQRLGIITLESEGLTSALTDVDVSKETAEKINQLKMDSNKKVAELIKSYKEKTMDIYPGRTLKETLELKILLELNDTRNKVGKLVTENISQKSGTYKMVTSGGRGSTLNMAQISALVGQQALRGKRINVGFSKRTLSRFKKNDLGSEAHGFIKNGYKKGLKPHEFFFGAMTGRDSLMDTALRTPKSGYLYRRLANALQDIKINYDETIRDASGKIIQFKYGEDGLDVSKTEYGKIDVKKIIEDTE